jgi:hypothetical protein
LFIRGLSTVLPAVSQSASQLWCSQCGSAAERFEDDENLCPKEKAYLATDECETILVDDDDLLEVEGFEIRRAAGASIEFIKKKKI